MRIGFREVKKRAHHQKKDVNSKQRKTAKKRILPSKTAKRCNRDDSKIENAKRAKVKIGKNKS